MMRHTPALVVEDEVDTPRLRILVRCLECDVLVTARLIDVSKMELVRAGDLAAGMCEEDAHDWFVHAGLRA